MITNHTEIVFILDRSGSMGGLESDTVGGFNSMLTRQQAEPGACHITTVLFDDKYEILHDRLDIRAVSAITEREYFVRGSTALLDAVGTTINKIDNAQKQCKPEYRADKVLFIITTDGLENSSREYSYEKVKSLIERQKAENSWEFIFLGANINAAEVAIHMGVTPNRAQTFHNDREGIALNYQEVGKAISSFRATPAGAALGDDWSEKIAVDYKRRKK